MCGMPPSVRRIVAENAVALAGAGTAPASSAITALATTTGAINRARGRVRSNAAAPLLTASPSPGDGSLTDERAAQYPGTGGLSSPLNAGGRPSMQDSQDAYERLVAQHRWEVPERYNIAVDVCDRHPREKLAMIHEHFSGAIREVSWGELQDLSNRFANLLAQHGVTRGDRVAVVMPPTPETAAVFFATWKLGALLLSMSVLYGDEGIRHRLGDAEPRVLVTDAANAERFGDHIGARLLVLEEGAVGGMPSDFDRVDTLADDPAQLYYTSGTTGMAKGIVHAHRYILAHEEFRYCHDVREGERFHGMGEWAWAAGICPLLGPWRLGAVQCVFQREGGFDAHKQLAFLSRHQVSNVFATPTAIRSMMSIADARTRYPQQFRIVCSAGEPLNPEAIRWFRDQYAVTVLDFYGLTESYPLC